MSQTQRGRLRVETEPIVRTVIASGRTFCSPPESSQCSAQYHTDRKSRDRDSRRFLALVAVEKCDSTVNRGSRALQRRSIVGVERLLGKRGMTGGSGQ